MNSNKVLNTSFLSGSHFTLSVKDLPDLEFNIQSCNLPGVSSEPVVAPVSTGYLKSAGDHLFYDDFEISFINDESLNAWSSVYKWQRAASPDNLLGENSNQYKQYIEEYGSVYREATLFVLTNSLNVNIVVNFFNIFPISLEGLQFSVTDTEDRKIISRVRFGYTHYELSFNSEYNINGSFANNHITF